MVSLRGVRRARVPEVVAWRSWCWGVWGVGDEGWSMEEELGEGEGEESRVGKSEVEGMEREDVRRVRVVGKWAVWKVDLWRRRRPPIDLGSVGGGSC